MHPPSMNYFPDLMRRHVNTLIAIAAATAKEWAVYRSHAIISCLVAPVSFLIMCSIWGAVCGSGGSVGGMNLRQLQEYYALTALVGFIIFDFADWNLAMLVRTGQFNAFLLRPVSHRFHAFSQKVGHRSFGFLLESLPIALIFIFVFQIDLRPAQPLWFLLSLILAFCMMFLINYTVGTLAFWTTRIEGVRRMIEMVGSFASGMLFPLILFPGPLQKIMLFLPFQFTYTMPLQLFHGGYSLGGLSLSPPAAVLLQAGAVLAMYGLSTLLTNIALRRFHAAGG